MVRKPIPAPPVTPGVARALSPLVRRISCSGEGDEVGVNTYVIGIDEVLVVDPGPGDAEHLDVLCGCGGDRIRWIVLTQNSYDHAAGAARLRELTGAQIFAPAGFDEADITLDDGYVIDATEFRVTAVAVSSDEPRGGFSFVLEQERILLSGDHVDVDDLDRVSSHKIKSIAPARGQYIRDVDSP